MFERFWTRNDADANGKFTTWCNENPNGYVFNFFKGTDKQNEMNIIHRVTCSRLHARGTKARYEKVCSNNLQALDGFADEYRGIERWRHCLGSDCFPEENKNNGGL
ncbi:hypothetical protein [Bacillus sp. FJAT-26390]|uniref:hypothetical protein n=1 Tax=Bacillus sp. FJAT-26390 TaxID=1743142 RepID=UPI000807A858|nr:hypothetical protein [Bacillus sp. FJAT-26390]OBZ10927.1 hypothetical protein A7975_18185 [Bacillus sp. FJAT-26390]